MASRGDEVPLLNQQGEAHDEQPDLRFAIDEETAEAQEAAGQYHDPPDSPKYPPSAPPPTYREATGTSLITLVWSRFFSSVSCPDFSFLRRFGTNVWLFICRFWPTSRFAQVGFFMLGLWLLVIVSGPAFEDAGPRAGSGYPWGLMDELGDDGPGPISGDGHVVAPLNWTLRSCHNSASHHGEVVCTSTTKVELDIPPPKAFSSNEGLFIFADPPREDHLGDNRGKVPGSVEFKLVEEGSNPDQSPKGKVRVILEAKYEKSKIEVFEKSTLVKMSSRIYSQGVGIYTYPLPTQYERSNPPPLSMAITVLIPAGSSIPAFRTQASAMNIAAFAKPEERSVKAQERRDESHLAPPTFGRFSARTGTGSIRTGNEVPLNAMGLIHFTTSNGDIAVAGSLHSQKVRLETWNGNIRLEEGCHVTGTRESQLITRTGFIDLKRGSWVTSGELQGKALIGGIIGGAEGGTWRTNKSLELHTSNGAIRAPVEVLKPTDLFYNPSQVVSVQAKSENGGVDLRYVGHERGVTLRSSVTTSIGAATAHMHANYEGEWSMEGTQGSTTSAPGQGDPRTFASKGRMEGPINVKEQGTIWFDPAAKHSDSQTLVRSSIGTAQLRF